MAPSSWCRTGCWTCQLRAAARPLVKCAVELPRAVVVDVDWLQVPTAATLAVFSSVWMQVADWPGVPIVLVGGLRTILELPRDPASVAAARRFVEVTCARWNCPSVFPDAVLIASELVENVIRHGSRGSEAAPRAGPGAAHRGRLRRRSNAGQAGRAERTGHRGLMLVARSFPTWSSAPTLSGGKVGWAVLRLP